MSAGTLDGPSAPVRLRAALARRAGGHGRGVRRELLATVDGTLTLAALLERRGAAAADDLARVAEDEEILLTVVDAAARRGEPVPAAWGTRAAPYASMRERLRRERADLHAALAAAGVPHVFVKGFGVERLYPSGLRRQFEDLDVGVPSIDELWRAAAIVELRGYRLRTFALGRFRGELAGTAKLAAERADVEVHFGGFPIRSDALVGYPSSLWAELRAAGSPELPPRWQALILLAETFDRVRPFARDRLDALAIGRALAASDRRWLAERARAHGLERELALAWLGPRWGRLRAARRAVPWAAGAAARRARALVPDRPGARTRLDGRLRALKLVDPGDRGPLAAAGGPGTALLRTPLGLFAIGAVEASPGGAATPVSGAADGPRGETP